MGAIIPSDDDLIKSGALRTTMGTAVGGVVVAIGTAINPVFKAVVGGDAPAWVRAIVLIAAVGAWAVVAAADLITRGRAAAAAMPQILTAPENLRAKVAAVGPDTTYRIAAVKFSPADSTLEYLAVRTGEAPAWKKAGGDPGDLEFVT